MKALVGAFNQLAAAPRLWKNRLWNRWLVCSTSCDQLCVSSDPSHQPGDHCPPATRQINISKMSLSTSPPSPHNMSPCHSVRVHNHCVPCELVKSVMSASDAGVKCCGVLWAAADVLLCRVSAGGPGPPPPPWRKLKPVVVAELLSCIAHAHLLPHWTIKPTLPINSDTGHISVHLAIFQQLCYCQSTQLFVDHTNYFYLT